MPTTINLPALDTVTAEVTVERCFQPVGAQVHVGQPLVVVFTERFEWEIPATAAGTITAILAEPGTTVPVGAPLVELTAVGIDTEKVPELQPAREPRATPVARRIAAEHGLALETISGSGCGGRITRNDVLGLLQASSTTDVIGASGNVATGPDSPQPPSLLAANPQAFRELVNASPIPFPAVDTHHSTDAHQFAPLAIPDAVTTVEVNMTRVLQYIERHSPGLAKRGIQITCTTCIAHVVVNLLGTHRLFNSSWQEDALILWRRIDLAVAGLPVDPAAHVVVTDAAALSVQGLARALSTTAGTSFDAHPTFTVSNQRTPHWAALSINSTQTAMLHIGAVKRRPIVVEERGLDTIVLQPMSMLTLTYDARIADQVQADALLCDVKHRVEHFSALC